MASGSEIARREGLHDSTVNELLHLKLLEPAIIQSILADFGRDRFPALASRWCEVGKCCNAHGSAYPAAGILEKQEQLLLAQR